MTRQVLKGIRNMVRMGGSISLRSGVEKILKNLYSCQLPANLNDAKHVYLCKVVMKIVREVKCYIELYFSISVESITEVVAKLHFIIENCGLFIEERGWDIVLSILERVIDPLPMNMLSSSDVSQRLGYAFKCVEYICHYSLFKIHFSSIHNLISVIFYLTTLKENLNIPLPSVALIQNIADYLSQQQVGGKLVNMQQEKICEVWIVLFTRLKEIGMDQRGDLRDTAYKTLDQIINIHGKDLGVRVWYYVLSTLTTELLQHLTGGYFESVKKADVSVGTPMVTEEDQIETRNWENSIKTLYTSLVHIIKELYALTTIPM